MIRHIIFLLLFSASVFYSSSILNRFQKITPDDGLSASHTLSIVSDEYGFIWIGTFDGLNRYDGYSIKVYNENYNEVSCLKGKTIYSLHTDKNGTLWIGTDKGLNRYNRETDDFTFIEDEYNLSYSGEMDALQFITSDNDGIIWAGGIGLFKIDESNKTVQKYDIDNNGISGEVQSIMVDSQDNLWIATSQGLDKLRSGTDSFTHFNKNTHPQFIPTDLVKGLGLDKNNNLWLTCDQGYITRTNLSNLNDADIINLCEDVPFLENDVVKELVFDDEGYLWGGHGHGGIIKLNTNTLKYERITTSETNPYSLNNNSIWNMHFDMAGNLWIGTFSGGVNVAYKYNQAMLHYSSITGNPKTLSYNNVAGFEEDSNGNIWICTDGGGLNKFDPIEETFKIYKTTNSDIGSNALLDVTEAKDGSVWGATWAGGLNRWNPRTDKIKSYNSRNSSLPLDHFFGVYCDSKGRIWASFFDGLVLFNPDTDDFTTYEINESSPKRWVLVDIEEDQNGTLWITSQNGLHSFNPETKQWNSLYHNGDYSKSIAHNFVTAIRQIDTDNYWITTQNGLNKYNKRTGKFEHFTTNIGFPSNNLKGLEIDDGGNLWIISNRGLSWFNPSSKEVKNYKKADGLQGSEFKDGATLKTRDGTLYFGGMSGGFNKVNPSEMKENKFIPNVVISDFKLFNKSVIAGEENSPISQNILTTEYIELDYSQSVISFDFISLNLEAADKNQYAYMMEGFDEDWVYCGNMRTANYTNLPAGNYTFRVKGSNNHSIWNDEGTSIGIYISPPFWETWWFRLLIVLSICAIVYYLVRRAKEKRKYLEEINQKLNAEIKHSKEAEEEKALLAEEARIKDEEAKKVLEERRQYLTGSVENLLFEMQEFSAGNLAVQIESNGQTDAIGQLYEGFNISVANIRDTIKEVVSAIEQNVSVSDQISENAQKMSNGAHEQSGRANDVAVAVEEMTANIIESSRNSEMAAKASKDAAEIALHGGQIVNETISGINQINEVVNEAVATVEHLGKSSIEIGDIVQLIQDIADQTNLLALNAAIEAARAGEHGRGFAVVSEEVKKLSERTTKATKEISEKIKRIQTDSRDAVVSITSGVNTVAKGKELATKAGESLQEIINSAEKVSGIIEQVAAANEEQSSTAEHISKSIIVINNVSRETAEGSEIVANAASDLRNLTNNLYDLVQQFNLEADYKKRIM